jgi:hypothetical protein
LFFYPRVEKLSVVRYFNDTFKGYFSQKFTAYYGTK